MSLQIVSFGNRTDGSRSAKNVLEQDWGTLTTLENYYDEQAASGAYEAYDGAIFATYRVTKDMMLRLSNAKVVTRYGAGVNEVDPKAATELGKLIVSTHTYGPETVAEHADRLLLAVRGWTPYMHDMVRDGTWHRAGSYLTDTAFRPTIHCTLGIVGLGTIGRRSAERQNGKWKRILAYDPYPDPNYDLVKNGAVEYVEFPELLRTCDAVIVHCAQTPSATRMFNKDSFAQMKPGSVFVNAARGASMVEEDLAEALETGHLGGAGLDVFADEPPAPGSPLMNYANSDQGKNLIFSPHCAGTITSTARQNIGQHSYDSLVRAIRLQLDHTLPWQEWPHSIINFEAVKSFPAYDDWKRNAAPSLRWRLIEAGEL